jgi:hypothetical protein
MSCMAGASCHYSCLTSSDPTVDVDGIIVTDEWHGDYYQFNQELDTQPMHTHTLDSNRLQAMHRNDKTKKKKLKDGKLVFLYTGPTLFPHMDFIWSLLL